MIKLRYAALNTRALTAALLVLMCGCMTLGPDYTPPEPDLPDAWRQPLEAGLAAGDGSLDAWWRCLNDPVLEELIAQAASGNLDLQAAAERIREARLQTAISRGQYAPTLGASGSAQRQRLSEATAPATPAYRERTEDYFELGAAVAWEPDFWGRIKRINESAQASEAAVREAWRDALVLLYAETAQTYLQLRTAQHRLSLAEENARLQRETLQLTQDRFKAGIVPKLDVRQAELNLATTESLIPSLDILQGQLINRISVLIGQAPGALHDTLVEKAPLPAPPESLLIGLPCELLRQRPDIRRAERALAAQNALIGVAEAERYPLFSLGGALNLQAYDSGDLLESGSRAYGFGPNFRWNLFQGGRVRNAIRVEESRTQQALLAYEQRVLLAVEEVENALVGYVRQQDRTAALQRSASAARESVSLVNTLYRTGLTHFQNVLDMQRSLFQQEDAMAASQGEAVLYLVRLYTALGGGWEVEETAQNTAE